VENHQTILGKLTLDRGKLRKDDPERVLRNKRESHQPSLPTERLRPRSRSNLVEVSSILPSGCKEEKLREIPAGSITHTVMARMDGTEGMIISAGIAWAWEKNRKYGLVAEAHGQMDRKSLTATLEWKIREMAKTRGIEISGISYQTEVLTVPLKNYGCTLAALIYVL